MTALLNPSSPNQKNKLIPYNNIIMNAFSPQRLAKLQNKLTSEPFLKALKQNMRNNQQKITKSVYNLESRNIKQFTKEWLALKKKVNSQASDYPSQRMEKPPRLKFGRVVTYEENETLQLEYDRPFRLPEKIGSVQKNDSHSYEEESPKTKPPTKNRYSLKIKTMERQKSREKPIPLRQKSISLVRQPERSVRMRLVSHWDFHTSKEIQSQVTIKKGESAPHYPQPQPQPKEHFLVNISRQRIDQYVQNLHKLQWIYLYIKDHTSPNVEDSLGYLEHLRKFKYDIDSSIDERAINFMISRRYNLLDNYLEDSYEKRGKQLEKGSSALYSQKLAEGKEYSLLDSLTKSSILHLMQRQFSDKKKQEADIQEKKSKKLEVYFSLPYCEFISYRETKSSIYQLINMGTRTTLKIAFSIYDKNRNGVVDQDDLLQMISLSRSFAFIQADLAIIARAMVLKKNKLLKRRVIKSQRVDNDSSLKRITAHSKESEERPMSAIKQDFSESENDADETFLSSSRFSIDKLYTFLKSRKDQNKQHQNDRSFDTSLQPLNFAMFSKAFQGQRPHLIYDLFQFLFSAPLEHFQPHIQPLIKNSPKIKLSTNTSPQQQTLEYKWNRRLKQTNSIIESFINCPSKLQ